MTLVAHAPEYSSSLEEIDRRIKLSNSAFVHDAYPVVIDDSLQTMGDAEKSLASETSPHRPLDLLVGLKVYR